MQCCADLQLALSISMSISKASNVNAVQEDIVNAMALTGQFLMGQAVMVKSSEVIFVKTATRKSLLSATFRFDPPLPAVCQLHKP